jgi:ABC-type nitrate/sulfonate/bicarbonate transport system substrate-binding protein
MYRRTAYTLLVLVAGLVLSCSAEQTPLRKVKINFPTRSAASWPMFIAKEGGYYEKNGLDVELVFGAGNLGVAQISSGEAVMTNSSMEQALQASSRDASLVMMGSSLNKGMFSLMASKNFTAVPQLKGKRFAVSQVGDAPYNYTLALLKKYSLTARDVEWLPVGTDATARATALVSGRADATLLTAPQYFRVEEKGFTNLANLADYDDVYASTVYLFTKAAVAKDPKLPEQIIKAHAEAINRYYNDKAFAVNAYLAYDKQDAKDIERIYDWNTQRNLIERIPYVLSIAVTAIKDQADSQTATQVRDFDVKSVVDNSVVDRLVKDGYFEKLFGAGIKDEIDRKSKLAVRYRRSFPNDKTLRSTCPGFGAIARNVIDKVPRQARLKKTP